MNSNIQTDLFGNNDNEVIRTLGFYQPFGTAMLHGKIETRWVRVGKKPPFPLGKYMLYTTQKECSQATLLDWCGPMIAAKLLFAVRADRTEHLNGYGICFGNLVKIEPMRPDQENECFVKYMGIIERPDKNGVMHKYQQQCLYFENIVRIETPFIYKGKQGTGFYKPEVEEMKKADSY